MPRKQPIWIERSVTLAIHDEQLGEHGGPIGIRDDNMLESAMARAKNLTAYGKPDLAQLAAAYGFGIARNHPFADGNKRTAFVAIILFLAINGQLLNAAHTDCVLTMLRLAVGELSEADLADWIRQHLAPRVTEKK
jgi:death on curing protein